MAFGKVLTKGERIRQAKARPLPPAPPSPPITAEGKARVAKSLTELSRFRSAPPSVLLPEAWPVLSDDAVLDWVKVDPEARSKVSWPVAQALAFLDGFKR